MSQLRSLAVAEMVLAMFLAGCGDPATETPSDGAARASRSEILLLAAASTREAVTEVARLFEKQTGHHVTISTAGSNALATQILHGAPADVFLAANQEWADTITDHVPHSKTRPLLSNDLVLVVPRGNPAQIQSASDLLASRVAKVALAGESVPAGKYAEQALRRAGLYDRLVAEGRLARGRDVRVTLSYVERGEAEAGVVYRTDALIGDQVETVFTFAADSHEGIVYPAVLLGTSAESNPARKFFEFLQSDAAGAVFRKYGFTPLAAPADGATR